MKIISNKEYQKLKETSEKYDLLMGQTVTFWTGERSRYKALLTLSKEELVRRIMDMNNYICQTIRKKGGI